MPIITPRPTDIARQMLCSRMMARLAAMTVH
jgi:hypothetical protein